MSNHPEIGENTGEVTIDKLLILYQTFFEKFNQEGDGIWARFNILVALNLALFAGFGFIWFSDKHPDVWRQILYGITIAGVLLSSWSTFVLRRLWRWHQHWRDQLIAIEEAFPKDKAWPKPHLSPSKWIKTDPGMHAKWPLGLTGYTQPFFWGFVVVWFLLLSLMICNKI